MKNSKFLSGLVKETKGVTKTAATWGTLHAVGLNKGLAKDPFWTVLKAKHGESVKTFLTEQGNEFAKQVVDGFVEKVGAFPLLQKNPKLRQKLDDFLHKAATQGVEKGVAAALKALPG